MMTGTGRKRSFHRAFTFARMFAGKTAAGKPLDCDCKSRTIETQRASTFASPSLSLFFSRACNLYPNFPDNYRYRDEIAHDGAEALAVSMAPRPFDKFHERRPAALGGSCPSVRPRAPSIHPFVTRRALARN